jgi:hypothetical protein
MEVLKLKNQFGLLQKVHSVQLQLDKYYPLAELN